MKKFFYLPSDSSGEAVNQVDVPVNSSSISILCITNSVVSFILCSLVYQPRDLEVRQLSFAESTHLQWDIHVASTSMPFDIEYWYAMQYNVNQFTSSSVILEASSFSLTHTASSSPNLCNAMGNCNVSFPKSIRPPV